MPSTPLARSESHLDGLDLDECADAVGTLPPWWGGGGACRQSRPGSTWRAGAARRRAAPRQRTKIGAARRRRCRTCDGQRARVIASPCDSSSEHARPLLRAVNNPEPCVPSRAEQKWAGGGYRVCHRISSRAGRSIHHQGLKPSITISSSVFNSEGMSRVHPQLR